MNQEQLKLAKVDVVWWKVAPREVIISELFAKQRVECTPSTTDGK